MGTLGGGNGGGRPPDNGGQPEGLPGLPPEWGTIVIPDDAAELAQEADEIRRQLRRQARRERWRRRLGLPAGPNGTGQPSLGLPLLIMSIAIMATLTSLFAVAWPGGGRTIGTSTGQSAPAQQRAAAVLDVILQDRTGTPVRIRELFPAVILLIDGCVCTDLVTATERITAPGVAVLAVDTIAPSLAPATTGTSVAARPLADRTGQLRAVLALTPAGGSASVVLIRRDGAVAHTVPATRTVDAFRNELAQLGQ
jgi:hypothetical protein